MRLLCLALLAAPALLSQVVEGTAADATTGAPVPGVKVELRQGGKTVQQAVTDGQGAFRLDAVKTGEYTAEFTKPGFRQPDRTAAVRRPFHVSEGGNSVHLNTRMMQLATVSGRVTANGSPVPGADVQLFIAGNFIGQNTAADARGEYRFTNVDPGTYILSARPVKGAPPPVSVDGRELGWAKTWFSLSTDRAGAAKLAIAAGAQLEGQEIALSPVPVYSIRGRVLSGTGEPVRGATVKVAPPDEIDVALFERETRTDADGAFDFPGLADGDWRVTAEAETQYASLLQPVAGRNVDRLEFRFVPPFSVTGKVVRAETATAAAKKPIGVMLAPKEGGSHLVWAIAQADDGAFRLDNVPQGTYKFMPASPGPPYYLASIETGGRDILGQYVDLAPGTLPVTITYRADGGIVRGTVEDCAGATVVIAPRNPVLQYPEFVRQAACQENGRFEIPAVRPGDYYAFAFDKPPGNLELSSFAGTWAGQALRISVRPGEATDASLKVIVRGSY